MTQFLLIRHGEANYDLANERQLVGGFRELVPLTENGRLQAYQLAQKLQHIEADLILSSPFTRALQTATILNDTLRLPLQVEFDLHEWIPDDTFRYDSSALVLSNFNEMMAMGGEWPEGEIRHWEPMSAMKARVEAVLRRYAHLEHVLVVCHGAVIRGLTDSVVETADFISYELAE